MLVKFYVGWVRGEILSRNFMKGGNEACGYLGGCFNTEAGAWGPVPRGEVGVAVALCRLGAGVGCVSYLPAPLLPSFCLLIYLCLFFCAPLLPFVTLLLFGNISLCWWHEKPRRSLPSEKAKARVGSGQGSPGGINLIPPMLGIRQAYKEHDEN